MQQFHIKLFYILGCDPNIMGIGPVPASRAALKSIGKDLNDMEIVDVRFLVVKKLIFFYVIKRVRQVCYLNMQTPLFLFT